MFQANWLILLVLNKSALYLVNIQIYIDHTKNTAADRSKATSI